MTWSGQPEQHVSTERLMARLDGAELCMYDPDGYLLVWFGGQSTGIHVYDASGTECAYWQVEQPATGSVPVEEIRQSMVEHRMSGEPYPS